MVFSLFILGAVVLVAIVIAIRRDLAQLETQSKMVIVAAPEPEPKPELESDPADNFQDERIVTGQLVPIGEHHCRASGGRGKRKAWRKTPKGKRRSFGEREMVQ